MQPTYPGVYVQEVPSGVRTITGVATSITAFVGRALRGPVNEPTTITSYSDYKRSFGGLSIDSTMSYAVRDFYLNGGSIAIIVRIINGAKEAKISLPAGSLNLPDNFLNLYASSPGAWGDKLSVEVNYNTTDQTAPSTLDPDLFNLIIYYDGVKIEEHLNVTLKETEVSYLPRILQQNSGFITIEKDSTGNWIVPQTRPSAIITPLKASPGSDGYDLTPAQYQGSESDKEGIYALIKTDLFNLLCIPPPTRLADTDPTVYTKAMKLCVDKRAMLLVDSPYAWGNSPVTAISNAISGLTTLGLSGNEARNAALYFPRVKQADPNRKQQLDTFVPCGIISGIFARTDSDRGVWKSPAGIEATLSGITGLQVNLTDDENGQLNPLGINCLRSFPVTGSVVWGARTLRGADQFADEYKYIAVRRTALFIEESLFRGTQWIVFEANDEPLWSQIRLNVGAFMHDLFIQGAFHGQSPKDAYFVKCDKETTTQNDINQGIVNIWVGFAPLKPAEFVILHIQQIAGQINNK